jgi:NADH:ubiquinone reductase (H+-translocating)
VATAALAPTEIAGPTRSILRNARNVTVRLDEAIGVEPARRQILLRAGGSLAYDYLVLATGVEYDYFGHDTWTPFAPSLKTLQGGKWITIYSKRLQGGFELPPIQSFRT